MNAAEEKRISDIEDLLKELVDGQNGLEKVQVALEHRFEGWKSMEDDRFDRTEQTFGELKGGQKTLIEWHIKNLEAVREARHRSTVTTWQATAAIVTAILGAVAAILKFA